MTQRIAAVQHGDYLDALRLIGRRDPEPYFGMGYSLRVLGDLFAGREHLVISLNAPPYRMLHDGGELVGMPAPKVPRPVPETVSMLLWAEQIRRELKRFRPTHLLLRSAGFIALRTLDYSVRNGVDTLVIFASRFDSASWTDRFLNPRLVGLLNRREVFLVGNHKSPATDSMVAFGVTAEKAVAWDWPGLRHPKDYPVKSLGTKLEVVYVGAIAEDKGVGDLIDAIGLLRSTGLDVRMTAAGDGPDLERMRLRAERVPGNAVRLLGRIGNDEAFRLMEGSSVVCVPSRHVFSEGMPLTLTEALASRSPVVISDHPVFVRAFQQGRGVRFAPEKQPAALGAALREVLTDSTLYRDLSISTAEAFARVECTTSFGDLLDRWRSAWGR